jgi:hypothetical protein
MMRALGKTRAIENGHQSEVSPTHTLRMVLTRGKNQVSWCADESFKAPLDSRLRPRSFGCFEGPGLCSVNPQLGADLQYLT